jgi:ethanolamine utilization microcompartment shell protein EutL
MNTLMAVNETTSAVESLTCGSGGRLNVDIASPGDGAGQDYANDWTKVKIESRAVSAPAKQTSGVIAGTAVAILTALDVSAYRRFTIYVKNLDSTDALTACSIYYSPDNTSWTDAVSMATNDRDNVSCATLAAGKLGVQTFSTTQRYIKCTATAAGGGSEVSSVDCWIVLGM